MRKKQKIINLFNDKNIFSIKHIISINSEEDLNQFWDFTTNSNRATYELIHTFASQFYNFAISYMRYDSAEFFDIILEDSENNFYFTLWNRKISLLFKDYMKKSSLEFLSIDNRITVKLDKSKYLKSIEKINSKNIKHEKNLINPTTKIKKLKPYDFLESDDLTDLLNLNDDMQEILYITKKSTFNDKIFISFRSVISLFCFTLRYYEKISPMATILTDFSNLINTNEIAFKNLS